LRFAVSVVLMIRHTDLYTNINGHLHFHPANLNHSQCPANPITLIHLVRLLKQLPDYIQRR
jgi:hypothetical protein